MQDTGRRDRRIVIERKQSTDNGQGGEHIAFTPRCTPFAKVRHLSGRELFLAQQVTPGAQIEFLILYRADVCNTDRVLWKGQAYDIQHLGEVGRNEELRILAKLPGDRGTG
jgi:SPP1 family predicted phage head-tail adaptor